MKVILTAFGGKLQSEEMEWPEKTRPTIVLMMNMGAMSPWEAEELSARSISDHKRGTFEYTGKKKWGFDDNKNTYEIREYKLIGIS